MLEPGDLLVVNTSATLPAALEAERSGGDVLRLHLSTPLPGSWPDDGFERWVVELRDGMKPCRCGRAGERLALPGGGSAELLAPYLGGARLWAARLHAARSRCSRTSTATARRSATATSPQPRPLADFQTDLRRASRAAPRCRAPAGRSASACSTRSARAASPSPPIVLHSGVSSLERGEAPYPERFQRPGRHRRRGRTPRSA